MTKKGRQRSLNKLATRAGIAVALVIASAGALFAQGQNSEPFNFGMSGGMGMSNAGRQTILIHKLYGIRPDHIIIGPGGGSLLFVNRGPSGIPVVTDFSGEPIPGFRRSWQGWANPLFMSRAVYYTDGFTDPGDLTDLYLGSWTNMVASSFDTAFVDFLVPNDLNDVDIWTWEVYSLSDR